MKKYYECTLLQVSENQGYIGIGPIDSETLKIINNEGNARNKSNCRTIVVEKTLNPNVVKEVITGILIPILKIRKKTILNEHYDEIQKEYTFSIPYFANTFVRKYKVISIYSDGKRIKPKCDDFFEINDYRYLKQYITDRPGVERQLKELPEFIEAGNLKMQNKLKMERESAAKSKETALINKKYDLARKNKLEETKKELKELQRSLKR